MRDMVVLLNLDNNACCAMARKLRSEHVYCKILPAALTPEELADEEALGLILCGGATGEAVDIPSLGALLKCDLPVLAMGDAALTLCKYLGGTLSPRAAGDTVQQVRFPSPDPLLRDVQPGERFLPGGRSMTMPSSSAVPIAVFDGGTLGFRLVGAPVYALAFQLEQHDPDGLQIVINFCHHVCGCTLWWSNQAFVERAREEIERIADGGEALCALSGGVDSAVCAMLGNLALGHRLHCIFVDTGLMRSGESDQVMECFQNQMGLNVKRVNAGCEMMEALRGVVGSEKKERIVFAHLRAILRREAAQMPGVRLILQGTNYADTLDSEPPCRQELSGAHIRLVEPVRELFKDEIRAVGEELQLPAALCQRQPFPASGLALRVVNDVTEEKLAILRDADAIFCREIEASGFNRRLFQYYASLADNPVPGEGCLIILRAVQLTGGGVSATASRLPSDLLERVTGRILTQLPGVRRVMYDLTPSRSYNQWK